MGLLNRSMIFRFLIIVIGSTNHLKRIRDQVSSFLERFFGSNNNGKKVFTKIKKKKVFEMSLCKKKRCSQRSIRSRQRFVFTGHLYQQ